MATEQVTGTSAARRESEEGRLPLLSGDRIWGNNWSFFWTTFAFGAATWAFLTGGLIGAYVDFPRGAGSFFAGHAASFALIIVAIVIPCAKYGIDMIDFSKTMFGTHGAQFVLIAMISIILGWAGVLLVLAQQATVNIWSKYVDTVDNHWYAGVFGILILAACWAFVSRGPRGFIAVAKTLGPCLVLLALTMFITILVKDGWDVMTTDPKPTGLSHRFTYSLMTEWAFGYGLSWWTAAAAYSRLSKGQRSSWWVMFVSWSVVQLCLVLIAIVAGVVTGQSDPTQWMIPLLGVAGGLVALAFVIIANWTSIAGIIYIAGVASQQIPAFRRIPWPVLCGILSAPGIYLAFWPDLFMKHYITFLSYNAILIAPIATIQAVDYWLLRKQEIDVRSVFSWAPGNRYWFWGGFNWVALGVCGGAFAFYLWLLNPISTDHKTLFEYVTASLPTIVLSAVGYYTIMRFVVIPLTNRGSYEAPKLMRAERVAVKSP
jgi:nucleobase:cation symporter-1, NCS1 family